MNNIKTFLFPREPENETMPGWTSSVLRLIIYSSALGGGVLAGLSMASSTTPILLTASLVPGVAYMITRFHCPNRGYHLINRLSFLTAAVLIFCAFALPPMFRDSRLMIGGLLLLGFVSMVMLSVKES